VETSANALGRLDRDCRITEHPVSTPSSSLRGVCVAPDGDLWYTANRANKIGRMKPNGTVVAEYPIPVADAGARCIVAWPDGRLFFTAFNRGFIGEVMLR
jgi:virginiamycin B lyase